MVVANRKFQFSSTFTNVSKLEDGENLYSPDELHFNIPWWVPLSHGGDNLAVYLYCSKSRQTDVMWTMETKFNFSIKASSGKSTTKRTYNQFKSTEGLGFGHNPLISWDEMMKDYLIDDSITIEVAVKITNMTGFSKNVLQRFDQSAEEFSDVIIVVEGQKFYVLKKLLAFHSTYFKALLLGNFAEADKSEVTLQDIDPTDFQYLLEVLYGESPIDDDTVDGILYLAHMFHVSLAIRKCDKFLIRKSKKSMRDLLRDVKRYQLENWRKSCLSKIKTIGEIKAAKAYNSAEMDPTVLAALLDKSLALERKKKDFYNFSRCSTAMPDLFLNIINFMLIFE